MLHGASLHRGFSRSRTKGADLAVLDGGCALICQKTALGHPPQVMGATDEVKFLAGAEEINSPVVADQLEARFRGDVHEIQRALVESQDEERKIREDLDSAKTSLEAKTTLIAELEASVLEMRALMKAKTEAVKIEKGKKKSASVRLLRKWHAKILNGSTKVAVSTWRQHMLAAAISKMRAQRSEGKTGADISPEIVDPAGPEPQPDSATAEVVTEVAAEPKPAAPKPAQEVPSQPEPESIPAAQDATQNSNRAAAPSKKAVSSADQFGTALSVLDVR